MIDTGPVKSGGVGRWVCGSVVAAAVRLADEGWIRAIHASLRTKVSDASATGDERERAAWLARILCDELDRRGVVSSSPPRGRRAKGRR